MAYESVWLLWSVRSSCVGRLISHLKHLSHLSATIVKLSLTGPHLVVNLVNRGLQYKQSNDYDAAKHEVYVLRACLQLAICGSYLLQHPNFDVPRILGALEAIKSVGIVKNLQGQQLLERVYLIIFYSHGIGRDRTSQRWFQDKCC